MVAKSLLGSYVGMFFLSSNESTIKHFKNVFGKSDNIKPIKYLPI